MPRVSKLKASRVWQVVQDPQSAKAIITASHFVDTSSMKGCGAGFVKVGLARRRILAPGKDPCNRASSWS